jgi:protein OS-9
MSGFPRCDLTGRPRQAELRFVCNEAALTEFIGDIFEPQSCEYTMVVFTNKICSVPHLR